MIHGYVQVSIDGQSVDAQVRPLRAASGAKIFREALAKPETGDVLMARTPDRLARSTRDRLNTLAAALAMTPGRTRRPRTAVS